MMESRQFQVAAKVIQKIEQAGFEAVIVGGAVRDYFLHNHMNDIDIATNALPEEIKQIFSSTVDVGIEHGTVLVLDEGEAMEVTTYRTDGTYIDYRRPDKVVFVRTLEEDLKRRDFTINAMAFTKEGHVIDLYGGRKDLERKLIRAVGNPEKRFQEDALRMLRAVRFCAQLGFSVEEKTLEAIQKNSHLIKHIAVERIHMELSKMWKSPFVYEGINALVTTYLSNYLKGNFEKTINSWKHFYATNPNVGWAYLCLVSNFDVQEIGTFYKLSNKEKRFIGQVLNAYKALLKGWTVFDYFQYDFEILETAYDFALWQQIVLNFDKEHMKQMKRQLPIQSRKELAINGHILCQWTNKKRGPWIKTALDEALMAVLTKKVENNETQLKEWFFNEFINEG